MTIDALENLSALKKWATIRQAEYIDSIEKTKSVKQTAKDLKVDVSTVYAALATLRKRAALSGYSPDEDMVHPVPSPFLVKGVSTHYNKDGVVTAQWVKSKLDDTKAREAIEEWVSWLVTEAKGLSPVITKPLIVNDDLLSVYPMGDPHFGMYAWAEEAGEDFDLNIAEQLTKDAINRLVDTSPPSKTALIIELGDFFHADNNTAMTPRSGANLDVDTRWVRVIQVGLRAMRYVILKTLEKHENVIVRIVSGNHDPHSSWALAFALSAYFENEPRVTIDLSAADVWYYRFGKVLIGATHGDKCKSKNLPAIMACDRPVDWGLTEHRFIYHGHIHHSSRTEHPGVLVESFRTLAARDAWHTASGYRSGRDMNCIVHHKDHGEISRQTCSITMIK
jgi:hypothetical protein